MFLCLFRGLPRDGAVIEVNTVDGFQVLYSYYYSSQTKAL